MPAPPTGNDSKSERLIARLMTFRDDVTQKIDLHTDSNVADRDPNP
ncbi:MAG: hypothetical protein VX438_00645 [Planctomycetota bacterium]|nr:hypothetical protein [Planctomycetota bacterium]